MGNVVLRKNAVQKSVEKIFLRNFQKPLDKIALMRYNINSEGQNALRLHRSEDRDNRKGGFLNDGAQYKTEGNGA